MSSHNIGFGHKVGWSVSDHNPFHKKCNKHETLIWFSLCLLETLCLKTRFPNNETADCYLARFNSFQFNQLITVKGIYLLFWHLVPFKATCLHFLIQLREKSLGST